MARIAFASWNRGLAIDDRILEDHLRLEGHDVRTHSWRDGSVQWEEADVVVIRSCWDYHLHSVEFGEWLKVRREAGTNLWNPAAILQWNMNKEYLRDLGSRGVPIPRTVWLERGKNVSLPHLLETHGLDRAVIKPSISASAHMTWRTSRGESPAHQAHLDEILRLSGAMLQEYVPSIPAEGEWSLVFLGGKYSHAVIKKPAAGDYRTQHEHGGLYATGKPPARAVESAEEILAKVKSPLLYARVDGVWLAGRFVLMELELLEPELLFSFHPRATHQFHQALQRLCLQ